MADDLPEVGFDLAGPAGEPVELVDGTGQHVGWVEGPSTWDPRHDTWDPTAPAVIGLDWALSWPSGASQPVWAPELPDIT